MSFTGSLADLRSLFSSKIGQGTEVAQGDQDRFLEIGQDQTELAYAWKFLRKALPANNTVVGDKDWDLPADFREVRRLLIGGTEYKEISEEESLDWDGDDEVFFVTWNDATSRHQVNLLTAPTSVLAITGFYLRRLPDLDTASYTTPIYDPSAIVDRAWAEYQDYNEEPDLAELAMKRWRRKVDAMIEIDRATATTNSRVKSNADDYGHVTRPAHLR